MFMSRVPQPAIDPAARDPEIRASWPGLVLSVVGLLTGLFGLGRVTNVETVGGGLAVESEVNMAFAHGGVVVVSPKPAPSPPAATGLPPWTAPQGLAGGTGTSDGKVKLQVDAGAKDPCPT